MTFVFILVALFVGFSAGIAVARPTVSRYRKAWKDALALAERRTLGEGDDELPPGWRLEVESIIARYTETGRDLTGAAIKLYTPDEQKIKIDLDSSHVCVPFSDANFDKAMQQYRERAIKVAWSMAGIARPK